MSAALIVAEPETATRGFLERQLADDGFEVIAASASAEALALAERMRPDLVLLSELDLCCRLREGEPGRSWDRHVPVILIGAAESDVVDRVRPSSAGRTTTSAAPSATRSCARGSTPCCGAPRRRAVMCSRRGRSRSTGRLA